MKAPLIAQARWESPLGWMTLAATEAGLAGAWFDAQKHHPGELRATQNAAQRWIAQSRDELERFFTHGIARFAVPLDLHGTPFQCAVWRALLRIEPGGTRSYSQLAQRIDSPRAVRAVGAAVGRNPVSVIVPCHRVLGSDGSLTGYAGGLHRKAALLQIEGADAQRQPRSRLCRAAGCAPLPGGSAEGARGVAQ